MKNVKKMRALKIFLKALLFALGLLAALWFFMPWKQVGEAVLLAASSRMPGVSVTYSTVENAASGFSVNNLEVKNLMGMCDVYFDTLTVAPDAAASLMGMSPTCRMTFSGAALGDIAVTPLRKIPGVALGSGRVVISVNRQGIFLDGLRSDGELSTSGSLLVNPSAMKIAWADVAMDIKSETFEENLPQLELILPLQKEGPGRWFLRRSQGAD